MYGSSSRSIISIDVRQCPFTCPLTNRTTDKYLSFLVLFRRTTTFAQTHKSPSQLSDRSSAKKASTSSSMASGTASTRLSLSTGRASGCSRSPSVCSLNKGGRASGSRGWVAEVGTMRMKGRGRERLAAAVVDGLEGFSVRWRSYGDICFGVFAKCTITCSSAGSSRHKGEPANGLA